MPRTKIRSVPWSSPQPDVHCARHLIANLWRLLDILKRRQMLSSKVNLTNSLDEMIVRLQSSRSDALQNACRILLPQGLVLTGLSRQVMSVLLAKWVHTKHD